MLAAKGSSETNAFKKALNEWVEAWRDDRAQQIIKKINK